MDMNFDNDPVMNVKHICMKVKNLKNAFHFILLIRVKLYRPFSGP